MFWNEYKKLTLAQLKSILYWFC